MATAKPFNLNLQEVYMQREIQQVGPLTTVLDLDGTKYSTNAMLNLSVNSGYAQAINGEVKETGGASVDLTAFGFDAATSKKVYDALADKADAVTVKFDIHKGADENGEVLANGSFKGKLHQQMYGSSVNTSYLSFVEVSEPEARVGTTAL